MRFDFVSTFDGRSLSSSWLGSVGWFQMVHWREHCVNHQLPNHDPRVTSTYDQTGPITLPDTSQATTRMQWKGKKEFFFSQMDTHSTAQHSMEKGKERGV